MQYVGSYVQFTSCQMSNILLNRSYSSIYKLPHLNFLPAVAGQRMASSLVLNLLNPTNENKQFKARST